MYSRYEATRLLETSTEAVDPTVSTSPGRGTASGLSMSASATLNTAAFAPMPIASEMTETIANPGFLASMRQP